MEDTEKPNFQRQATIKIIQAKEGFCAVGGIRFEGFLRLHKAMELRALVHPEEYAHENWKRQTQWLSALKEPTYQYQTQKFARQFELRFISQPGEYSAKIELLLLVNISAESQKNLKAACRHQVADLNHHLCVYFPEYKWQIITQTEKLNEYLDPFLVQTCAEVYRETEAFPLAQIQKHEQKSIGFQPVTTKQSPISRNCSRGTTLPYFTQNEVRLDTSSYRICTSSQTHRESALDSPNTQAKSRLSEKGSKQSIFLETAKRGEKVSRNSKLRYIPMIASYQVHIQGWSKLAIYIQQLDIPICVRICLKPTKLAEDEEQGFQALLGELYKLQQSKSSKGAEILPFQKHLHALLGLVSERLLALQSSAFEVRTQLASPDQLSQGIVECFGSSLTSEQTAKDQKESSTGESGYQFKMFSQKKAHCKTLRILEPFENIMGEYPNQLESSLQRLQYLMDLQEAQTAFHMPFPEQDSATGFTEFSLQETAAPQSLSTEGCQIGYNQFRQRKRPIFLSEKERFRHAYLVGQTGAGKSTLCENMILEDIKRGKGLAVFDPHGDLVEEILQKIPKDRANDVIYLDPADAKHPFGINILEYQDQDQKHFVVQELISIIERIFDTKYTGGSSVTGPMFYHYLRMGLLYVMSDPGYPTTLMHFYKFFAVPDYYKNFNIKKSKDPLLESFAKSETFNFKRGSDSTFSSYIITKFDQFLSDPLIRNIVCQPKSTLDFDQIMNDQKILLVNLSKGRLGELNSRFLGMLMISKLYMATLKRAHLAEDKRADFFLYVDEFQNLASTHFENLLAEARKYKVGLVLANQSISQIPEDIANALLGNVGTTISFRISPKDAEKLKPLLTPTFSERDLTTLPNWQTIVKTTAGSYCPPFTMHTHPAPNHKDQQSAKWYKVQSQTYYCQKRSTIESYLDNMDQELKNYQLKYGFQDTQEVDTNPYRRARARRARRQRDS